MLDYSLFATASPGAHEHAMFLADEDAMAARIAEELLSGGQYVLKQGFRVVGRSAVPAALAREDGRQRPEAGLAR